jgi:hypothetical protein
MERQAQEVGIGYLLMANDPRLAIGNGVEQPDIVWPELVSGMGEVGSEQRDSVGGYQCVR